MWILPLPLSTASIYMALFSLYMLEGKEIRRVRFSRLKQMLSAQLLSIVWNPQQSPSSTIIWHFCYFLLLTLSHSAGSGLFSYLSVSSVSQKHLQLIKLILSSGGPNCSSLKAWQKPIKWSRVNLCHLSCSKWPLFAFGHLWVLLKMWKKTNINSASEESRWASVSETLSVRQWEWKKNVQVAAEAQKQSIWFSWFL